MTGWSLRYDRTDIDMAVGREVELVFLNGPLHNVCYVLSRCDREVNRLIVVSEAV